MSPLVLSIFPGMDVLGLGFENEGFTVVRGPDIIFGGDIKKFHPPAHRFDGVIGGPPCQCHSRFANLNRARGNRIAEDLIPEFSRVVHEAAPDWFIMENVPDAPGPETGYFVQRLKINNRNLGEIQNRERVFFYGTRTMVPAIETLIPRRPENPVWCRAVKASGYCKPGNESVRGRQLQKCESYKTWDQLRFCLELQGLDPAMFDNTPFTVKAAFKLVGNAVPLPMARAVARAVRQSFYQPDLVTSSLGVAAMPSPGLEIGEPR